MHNLPNYRIPEGVDPLTEAFSHIKPITHGRPTAMGSTPIHDAFKDWAPQAYMNRIHRPLALYLHVPFCRRRCLFCPFYQNKSQEGFSSHYRDYLIKEIDIVVDSLGDSARRRTVSAVFFGGGTPSDMHVEDMVKVLTHVKSRFAIDESTELTIEGRVRGFTREKVEKWVAAGANRFSLGLQSTDEGLRKKLGRLADRDEIKQTLTALEATGALVIVDLMFGLPGQTESMLREDIRFLAEETPIAGLDMYELIQFPNSPLAKAMQSGSGRLGPLPDAHQCAHMYAAGAHALAEYNFEHFAPQHWRRTFKERSLYNRLAKSDADIIPFGTSAGGTLGTVSLRHDRDIALYEVALSAGNYPVLASQSTIGPEVLRLNKIVAEFLERRLLPPLAVWPDQLSQRVAEIYKSWVAAGILELSSDFKRGPIALTLAGSYWVKSIKSVISEFISDEMVLVY